MESGAGRDERVMAIVTEALKRLPGEREEYVRGACQGDDVLLREASEALEWEQRMSGFLREPAASAEPTLGLGAPGATGAVIGPYRLLEKIGEGGMAEVWRGEQTTPVHRTVAIKLIKAGMETKAMIARFESERQALALMDHPAIARVFDAGATAEGRPYFVMEYVPGMPITDYCDKYRLSTRERLELFMQVCEGVQHAHQKAIIHRDLKPSNVLISVQDGKPAIKIIDFGVAKALAQRLTEKTMFTEMGMLVGTPEYMSPEQAEMTGHNVDTRTDVYSLGLILYELLVGALPFDSKELRKAGFAEILRRIREEDPPRPSTRFRTLGDGLAASARNRKTEPGMLTRQLQVDLDWISMKALEKDQTRRYGSPSDLAAEIGRYLRDEPVLASPPSVAYRAGKFVRRHRTGVGVAAGVLLLLLGFAITMTVQARRIARERDRANREAEVSRRVRDFLTGLFQVSAPSEARGNSITAREILDKGAKQIDTELSTQPEIQAQLMATMGNVYRGLGLFGQAQPLLERAAETRRRVLGPEHRDTLQSIATLADLYINQGRFNEAERLLRPGLEVLQRTLGSDDIDTFRSINILSVLLFDLTRYSEETKLLEEALPRERRALGPENEVTLTSTLGLASVFRAQGRVNEAVKLSREVVAARRRTLGPEHPRTLFSMGVLGDELMAAKQYQEAEHLFREVLEIERRVLGPEHPDTLIIMYNLGQLLMYERHYPEAENLFRQVLEIQRRVLGPEHLNTLHSLGDLAWAYLEEHRYADADRTNREALSIARRVLPHNHTYTAEVIYNLACSAAERGKRQDALAGLRLAIDHGYRRPAEMAGDESLKSLHGDPRFTAMLEEVRSRAAAK
jgi:non-specific serine/threonine protein kinase/serine/threonine-protein kinase